MQKDFKMDAHEIKYHLSKKGITQRMIAKKTNRSPQAVSAVIYRQIKSNYIANSISEALKIPKTLIFPDYLIKEDDH